MVLEDLRHSASIMDLGYRQIIDGGVGEKARAQSIRDTSLYAATLAPTLPGKKVTQDAVPSFAHHDQIGLPSIDSRKAFLTGEPRTNNGTALVPNFSSSFAISRSFRCLR